MNKIMNTISVSVFLLALSACAHVEGEASPKMKPITESAPITSFDVNTVSCWDVLTIAEEDMNMAMMLLYGYSQGVSRVNSQSSSSIETAFRSAFTYCEANPDAPAMNGFK